VTGGLTTFAKVGSLRAPTSQCWLVGPHWRTDPVVRRSFTRRRKASGYRSGKTAITSISIRASRGSRATCTVERAGGGSETNFA
jgi:hypothetical protein